MDTRTTTRRFDVTPCVMLIALGDGEAELCTKILKPLTVAKPMAIMRVAHIRAACERMLVTRPMIVVFSEGIKAEDKRLLSERAEDITAEIVQISEVIDTDKLKEQLFVAMREANLRHGY